MVASGGVVEDNGLCVGEGLLVFKIGVRESFVSQEFALVQYMEVICLKSMVDETPGFLCLKWSSDDEVDHSLRHELPLFSKTAYV